MDGRLQRMQASFYVRKCRTQAMPKTVILRLAHGTTQFGACIQAQNRGIMQHILPDRYFLTTKKLRFTKDKRAFYTAQFAEIHYSKMISLKGWGISLKSSEHNVKRLAI